jgi:hydrogenase-4 component B
VSVVVAGLAAIAGLTVVTVAAVLVAADGVRAVISGVGTVLLGAAGVGVGVAAMAGHDASAWLPQLLPLFGIRLELDALGGMFTAVAGAVAMAAGVYGVGYTRSGLSGRTVQAATPVFVAVMLLVPAAASVSSFLLLWEVMAGASLLLVLAEHRRRAEVVRAGLWYAVMTHAGMMAVLTGLWIFAAAAHGESFAALRAAGGQLPTGVRSVVFVVTLLGFASKAGAVPLHVWLPRAHPEAPSHVSALMSAAMVNLGVYGIVRVGFDLLAGGPSWWWLVVMGMGAASALYGILQAAIATDLKRLLGYSTSENMGLVLLGVGAAGLLAAGGNRALAAVALTAALLHIVNHAAFKTLLFCAAGSVLHAAGSRDLDALGGLRSRMPVTTALFAVGALGAAALPPGNGFVSEWLLLQSFIHALPAAGTATAVAMPVAVGVIALTAGLAVATFVKALGVGFFARPRSRGAEQAHEAAPTMLAGMAVAAAACAALALAAPAMLAGLAGPVRAALPGAGELTAPAGVRVVPGPFAGSMSPLLITLALLMAVLACLAVLRAAGARRTRRAARLWDCGNGVRTARTQYTATSFAEPLQRVFDDVLRPEQDVTVTPHVESRYLLEQVAFHRAAPDRVESRLYGPLLSAVAAWGRAGRRLATGSVHRYLGYGFATVVALLLALAVTR